MTMHFGFLCGGRIIFLGMEVLQGVGGSSCCEIVWKALEEEKSSSCLIHIFKSYANAALPWMQYGGNFDILERSEEQVAYY